MRIAMLAMSGVRACDTELLELGLTLPGFVERSKTIASLPSLGLLTLAGMTPEPHVVDYLEVDRIEELAIDPSAYDLAAISTFTAQAPEAYRLAKQWREAGVPVVMGGLHATCAAEQTLEHVDAVVVGEGELAWPDVLADVEAGELRCVYDVREQEFDLAESPMPAFELLDIDRYNRLTVQTSRGCPWRCSFCASSILLTSRYKQKPIERVLAEVDRICELWPRPFIEFADDNSFVNRGYWKRLLPELAKRRIRWFTETDIAVADDDELLAMLAGSGCVEVLIGLESPSPVGLQGLELRRDWKLKQYDRYGEAVRRIQSHGVRVNGCFIVGLDGHTPDIFGAVLNAAREYELFDVQVTLPTPFPGTAFYEQLRSEGRLIDEKPWDRCTLFDITFEPTPMSAEQLRSGFHELVVELYSDNETAWRKETFRRKYARGRRRSA